VEYYTYQDLGVMFAVSEKTVMRWVSTGRIPSPSYFGVSARFPHAEIERIKFEGLSAPGTYKPVFSVRSVIGKRGALAKRKLKRRRVKK
jgi:predicted DNA-binding transcriptional regulator AlpA